MVIIKCLDIDNLNLSIFWTFVVIDDKGGEKQDISVSAKGRNIVSAKGRNSVLR